MLVSACLVPISSASGQQLDDQRLYKASIRTGPALGDATALFPLLTSTSDHQARLADQSRTFSARAVFAGGLAGGIVGGVAGYLQKTYVTCPFGPDKDCSGGPHRKTGAGAFYGALLGGVTGALLSYWR